MANLNGLASIVSELRVERTNLANQLQNDRDPADVSPLSDYSSLLRKFTANEQELLYVKPEDVSEAKRVVQEITKSDHSPQMNIEFPGGSKGGRKKEVASAS